MRVNRKAIVVIVISLFWAFLFSSCKDNAEPEVTPTPIPIAPSYDDVLEYYRSGITDMQRLNYQETKLLNHRVQWSGWVINVRDDLNDFSNKIMILDMSGDTEEFGGKINIIGPAEVFGPEAQVDLRLYFSGMVEEIDRNGVITVRVDSLLENPQAGTVKVDNFDSLLSSYQTLENREWMRVRQNAIGSKVSWVGYVINVTEDGVALLSAHPDNDEADMMLSGLSSEKALALHMGQKYSFTATIIKIDMDEVITNSQWKKIIVVYLNAGDLIAPTPDLTTTPAEN